MLYFFGISTDERIEIFIMYSLEITFDVGLVRLVSALRYLGPVCSSSLEDANMQMYYNFYKIWIILTNYTLFLKLCKNFGIDFNDVCEVTWSTID